MEKFIRINPRDNVAVCLEPVVIGEKITIGVLELVVKDEIPVGHKMAIYPLVMAKMSSNMVNRSGMLQNQSKLVLTSIRKI